MKAIKNIRKYLIYIFASAVTACSFNLNVNNPVDLLWDKTGKKTDRLIIFLPGLYDTADKFKDEDFFLIARKAGITADMVSANVNVLHLVEDMMVKRIESDVFLDAKNNGYKNIWLVGVSLGGLNSLLFYREHSKNICGVVTLAPYVANKPLIKEIQDAENIKYWVPGSVENEYAFEKKLHFLWVWLKEQVSKNNLNNIYLGYGKQDMHIEGIKLLQNILDKKNIVTVEGGHNWETGQKIWQQQLLTRSKTGLLKPCH
ncbi:MAG: alpha/beta hydrolase [Gammaproteobacteria bacterium]|nr:alpha/beta hydrolase [Gammaproteobacteria bacterium]